MLAAMPRQIPLPVTVYVEPPRNTTALNGGLPDRGVDRLSAPRDIARQTHIHRKQARHRALLPVFHRGYPLTWQYYAPRIAASVAIDCGRHRNARDSTPDWDHRRSVAFL